MSGRKHKNAVVVNVVDTTLDQPKIANAMVQMRADGVAERQAHEAALFDLGRAVGGIQMAQVTRQFSAVAEIKLFEEIKESNKFKDLAIRGSDGNFCRAENIDDFCRLVFGSGYKAMNEESLSLRSLGEASYEAANRLGLNRKQLRLIRSLPDAQRGAVAEAIQAESKAEVVAIIEDLASQLAQAQEDAAEQALEKAATEKIVANLHKQNDKLSRHIAKSTPDKVLLELQQESTELMNDALCCVRGQIRQAFIALKNHGDDDHSVFMAGLLGQLQADVRALREEFNLPDLSTAAELQLASEVAQWGKPAAKAKG